MKNQKGFIQIPLLIAIIAGVLVLGGAGYFGEKQYKNYWTEKEAQQRALEETQTEIEKLKNKPSQVIIQEKSTTNTSNLINLIEQWRPRVAKITCRFDDRSYASYYGVDKIATQGSGYLTLVEYRNDQTGKIDEVSYAMATNAHVVRISPQKNVAIYKSRLGNDYSEMLATSCDVNFDKHETVYKTINIKNGEVLTTPFGLGYIEAYQDYSYDPDGVDFALIKIASPDTYIKQNVGNLASCSNVKLGEKVVIFGFPGIGSESGITVTEGIISGDEKSHFVTSAKIDSGNSGGIAVSADRNCFIGTPTATVVGKTESLGRILKTEYILRTKGIFKSR